MNIPPSAKHHLLLNAASIGVIVTIFAAMAAALYTPLTKLVSADAGLMMSTAFLFLGSGCGLLILLLFGRKSKTIYDPERRLQKKDTWKIIPLIFFAMLGAFLMNAGIQQETAATSSILQNLIPITTIIFAALFLKEKISKRLGIGVALIVLGSISLAITDISTFAFSMGSLLLIVECISIGASFTITKLLADRNPVQIMTIRGLTIAAIAFIIALCIGEALPSLPDALGLMAVGFIGCGLAPMLLMYGQRHLGAAKAGAIYSIYPLLGVLVSIPLFGETLGPSLLAALILFIPGMYFVTTKNSGKTAAEAAPDQKREDAEYLQSISEEKKTGMKNQLTSFGFLIVAMFFVLMVLGIFDKGASDAPDVFSTGLFILGIILSICLFLIGIILLVLGKRVLTAVTFILTVSQILSFVFLGNIPIMAVLAGSLSIIFAFILLTSTSPQKYAFAAVNALLGAAFISNIFSSAVCSIIVSVAAVFLIWLSLVCGTGKLQRSISKHLTEDGDMTFSRCGAVIGFLLIAKNMATSFIYGYFSDSSIYFLDSVLSLGIIYTCLIAFVGAALLFIGKRQMTAVFFFGGAIVLSLDLFSDGMFVYLPVIFSLVFAILIIIRGASLILPTFLMIADAFATLLYLQLEAVPEVQTAMLLLSLACTAVTLYLSFAVVSEKPKLPVF